MRALIFVRELLWKEFKHHMGFYLGILALWAMPLTASMNDAVYGLYKVTPILGLWLGFQLISDEWKGKTWSFALTKPVSREILLLTKFIACLAWISLSVYAGSAVQWLSYVSLKHRWPAVVEQLHLANTLLSSEPIRVLVMTVSWLTWGMLMAFWFPPRTGVFRKVLGWAAPLLASVALPASDQVSGRVLSGLVVLAAFGACIGFVKELQVKE